MDKKDFDQAMGEVPPSTVNVDAIIAHGHRAAWVRRAVTPWTATAAGVVAVTFGITAAVLPANSGGSGGPAAPPPSTSSPTTSPTSSPPPPQRSPCEGKKPTAPAAPEQPTAAVDRLTGVLTASVQGQLAPGSQLSANPEAGHPEGTQHGPLVFFHIFSDVTEIEGGCQGGEDSFLAQANVNRSGQKGNITAVVGRLGGNTTPQTECTPANTPGMQVDCDRQVGPNREVILTITLRMDGGGPTVNEVDVTKPDGTGILLYAENVSGSAKKGGPPESPTPPLTHEQLIGIALNPGMTLYPTN